MKYIKWKILLITCLICLLPIAFGFAVWDRLPDVMAIHFDINNNADNFVPKGTAVIWLPAFMTILQIFCCIAADMDAKKNGEVKKFEVVSKWITPVICLVLQSVTIGIGLGYSLDVRKVAVGLVGLVFILLGKYMPELDHVKNYKIDKEKARKINRFIGRESVIMGVLFVVSIFLPPIASIVCLLLLIPYTVISVIYGIKVGRK